MKNWIKKWLRYKWRRMYSSFFFTSVLITTLYASWTSLQNYSIEIESPFELFTVNRGDSVSSISSRLTAQGVLPHSSIMKIYTKLHGVEKLIQEGEYLLTPRITLSELVNKMVTGDRHQYKITLVEGWSLHQVMEELGSLSTIDHQIGNYDSGQIAELLGLDVDSAEGMLFPDTYFFTRNTSDLEILKRANLKLNEVLNSLWETRASGLPYKTSYEALILASIIEKESGLNTERNIIASVFLRRINFGMRLQSDPTVIYGMGRRYEGNLTRENLSEVTAYNTYRIDGLPPTPISLAGKSSIEASLNPSDSTFLYFVSQGDGSHYFSETLSEHNNAVNLYQRESRSN